MISALRIDVSSHPAIELVLRAVAIAVVALAIVVGLPILVALAG